MYALLYVGGIVEFARTKNESKSCEHAYNMFCLWSPVWLEGPHLLDELLLFSLLLETIVFQNHVIWNGYLLITIVFPKLYSIIILRLRPCRRPQYMQESFKLLRRLIVCSVADFVFCFAPIWGAHNIGSYFLPTRTSVLKISLHSFHWALIRCYGYHWGFFNCFLGLVVSVQ